MGKKRNPGSPMPSYITMQKPLQGYCFRTCIKERQFSPQDQETANFYLEYHVNSYPEISVTLKLPFNILIS